MLQYTLRTSTNLENQPWTRPCSLFYPKETTLCYRRRVYTCIHARRKRPYGSSYKPVNRRRRPHSELRSGYKCGSLFLEECSTWTTNSLRSLG